MFAAKELYAELVVLSYSQRAGDYWLDEDQLQISEL